MKLYAETKSYLWGGTKLKEFGKGLEKDVVAESWEVSVHKDGPSKLEDGTLLSDYIKNNPKSVDKNGSPFPILIKYIDAKQNLSVQVHPNDEFAKKEENDNGKTEMWYIVSAEKDAGIYCGLKKDSNKKEFMQKVEDGTVEELLNFIPVKEGDCFLIKAGTVHAICAGCLILEVQQSSNVTYRVYDYNRVGKDGKKRELHVEKASKVINYGKFKDETGKENFVSKNGANVRRLTKCKYFDCQEVEVNGTYTLNADDSFLTVCIIKGKGMLNGKDVSLGDSFFIPMNESAVLSGKLSAVITKKP